MGENMDRKVLGRGLNALIPETGLSGGDSIAQLKVDDIVPSRYQPREDFNADRLKELIASIEKHGVVQPVLVRPVGDGRHELIAGERRWRAAKALGLAEIPAIEKKGVSDNEVLQISLIENIQREDLNPIEEATAYERLVQEFGFTQEQVAQVVGKDRASVANSIRLLKLPAKVQENLSRREISMGHARALLSLESAKEQIEVCQKIISRALSVRQTESVVARHISGKKRSQPLDHGTMTMQEELQHFLGTRVRIVHGRKRGKIIIEYFSAEDLERIVSLITAKKD
jgi:ParB family chromosome partitioning protein